MTFLSDFHSLNLLLDFATLFYNVTFGFLTLVISYYVHSFSQKKFEENKTIEDNNLKISKDQYKTDWLNSFKEQHKNFWNDEDYKKIRACLANDFSYNELKVIITKRLSSKKCNLSIEEYDLLDKLDKFYNFLLSVSLGLTSPIIEEQFDLVKNELFFKYWGIEVVTKNRIEVLVYIDKFYKNVLNKLILDSIDNQEDKRKLLEEIRLTKTKLNLALKS